MSPSSLGNPIFNQPPIFSTTNNNNNNNNNIDQSIEDNDWRTNPQHQKPLTLENNSSRTRALTIVAIAVVALITLVGLLFVAANLRLRHNQATHKAHLQRPLATGKHFMDFVGIFNQGGQRHGGSDSPNSSAGATVEYGGLFAPYGVHQPSSHTLHHAHHHTLRQQGVRQNQLLVSIKDNLSSNSNNNQTPLFGTHKPQPVNTQLIVGLNHTNPLNYQQQHHHRQQHLQQQQQQQHQIYGSAACHAPYATHYSASLSVGSSSNGGANGGGEYAVPFL